jgi:cytochrome c553
MTPTDIAEGKHLAGTNCAGCHGANGISVTQGNRGDSVMANVAKVLNDDALVKVAAYFAGLDPAPALANSAGPVKLDAVQAGKTVAAAACAGCHGDAGVTQIPAIPSLVGLDPKYLTEAMKAYKSVQRKNDTMKAMLASVTEPAMNNIALFYALQAPKAAKTPAAGDQAAGKEAAASCAGCHGEEGVSGSPATPSQPGWTGCPVSGGCAAGLQRRIARRRDDEGHDRCA